MSKQKILILNEQCHCKIGGTERYVRDLIKIISKDSNNFVYEVTTFNCTNTVHSDIKNYKYVNNKIFQEVVKDNSHNSKIQNIKKVLFWFKVIWPWLRWSRFVNKFIKSNDIDIVIDNTFNIPNGLYSLPKKTKCIWIQHFDIPVYLEKNIFLKALRKIGRLFLRIKNRFEIQNIVVFSDKDKSYLSKSKITSSKNNIFEIPLASYTQWEINNKINKLDYSIEKRNEIAFIGRLDDYQKNLKFIKDIFDNQNELSIHIYGSGNDDNIFSNSTNIINHGPFDPNNIDAILEKVKFIILPSRFEGFPFVIVEALSNGIPCIIADTYLNANYLINNNRGYCIKGFDREEWFNTIKKMYYLNESEYKTYAKNCINFAYNNLSIDKFEKNWINLLKSI